MEKNLKGYQILRSIGKGGMGEVFLARDEICGREVALKQMRTEWQENSTMRERFLREAHIAAELSHPNIIPIYSIDEKGTYYTMPQIEGETLKSILRETNEQLKQGDPLHPIGSSVPSLVRIFLSVCSAIAYAHDRNVLHRDLKPENIIVGKYGEVIILDWGLANFINAPEKTGPELSNGSPQLTRPGKVPGTLLYMAPERAFGAASSVLTDIYSLGVVLYQILTLRYPFRRSSLKEFRKTHKHEEILDPEEVAPDREISPHLSSIVQKCLSPEPKRRYQTVEELIQDVENYIEGLPEWMNAGNLMLSRKEDWQFQENVVLAKHMALTRGVEMLEWVNLMISKAHFPGSIKIEAELILHKDCKGLGLLFCMPEGPFLKGMEEAYCLWLSQEGIRLYRSNVEMLSADQTKIENNRPYSLRIEKVENYVRFFLDGILCFSFLSHIPLSGSQVGVLLRDANLSLSPLRISVGSQNIMVNCLAVPDAFLARKQYKEAIDEYRKISDSFPGRAEGREATFRAGMTLLKQAKEQSYKTRQELFFEEALSEFEKLHKTAAGPLEYLGKSLVYKAQNDLEEEVKCLELALRRYPKHPLKPVLVENILSRLYETSQSERKQAFSFALLTLRHLSHLTDVHAITDLLETYLEPLSFLSPSENKNDFLIIQLAFWLNRPLVLKEMQEKGLDEINKQNASAALLLLGHEIPLDFLDEQSIPLIHTKFNHALIKGAPFTLPDLPDQFFHELLSVRLWMALLSKDWKEAKKLVEKAPQKVFANSNDNLFFLYGCYLAHTKGEEAALTHLTNVSEKPYPPTSALLSHFLLGRIDLKKEWMNKSFLWEKLRLFQQLQLYSLCADTNPSK